MTAAKKRTIDLAVLKPNSQNPRFISDDKFKKLCNSIEQFPKMMELRPIIVDADNVVLAGNMRLKSLKHLGYKQVPETWVKQADKLTEDEKKRFIITDNSGFGEWDYDMLANEWEVDDLKNWGVNIPEEWGEKSESDPFDDPGITAKNQYGVIVIVENETEQESTFEYLTSQGYNCKVVVT